MSHYQREQMRRYQQKLDAMSEQEFAQEGLRHLAISTAVTVVISFICVADLVFRPGAVAGAVILMFVLFCAPFMVLDFFVLRKAAQQPRQSEGEGDE